LARVVLTGSQGQLASDIARLWPQSQLARRGDELVPLPHAALDVTDAEQARRVLAEVRPRLVINTAAFLRVDDCEREATRALLVNAVGPKNLAEACREAGAKLAHFSTDYVFDGKKRAPYLESDAPRPLNAYAVSKLAGEHFVRYLLPVDHLIVRSSGLYGVAGSSGKGGNFVETMLGLARGGGPIRVVNDQVTCPTHTLDFAATFLDLLGRDASGLFHVTNAGQCSWYEFAAEVFAQLKLAPELAPVTSDDYGAPARRPAYSVLANARLNELGLAQPRPWQEALRRYLELKGYLVP